MKRLILGVGLAGLLALGLAGNAMASGYEFTSGAGEIIGGRQFNFTAHKNTQGVVGQMHLDDGAGDQAVADVVCLYTDGNNAVLAGTVTRGEGNFSTTPPNPPTQKIIFDVLDNDNGNSGTPPLVDGFLNARGIGAASDADCQSLMAIQAPLMKGNIVVNNGTKLMALGWPWP